MNVELDKIDLIRLIKGTQPDYAQMHELKVYGQYWEGSTQAWLWDSYALETLREETLFSLYKSLISCHINTIPRRMSDNMFGTLESKIEDIKAVLEDGKVRGNIGQVEAAQKEIERLENLK